MAAQLYETLQTRLLSLPNELEIYPGHQAGSACGDLCHANIADFSCQVSVFECGLNFNDTLDPQHNPGCGELLAALGHGFRSHHAS